MSARGNLHRARMLGTMSARDWAVGATSHSSPLHGHLLRSSGSVVGPAGGCWPLLGDARRVYAHQSSAPS
jgi:hypothetical protein